VDGAERVKPVGGAEATGHLGRADMTFDVTRVDRAKVYLNHCAMDRYTSFSVEFPVCHAVH